MHDVAKNAGVAISTLYRYFPSKIYLFTAVQGQQVDWLDAQTSAPRPGQAPEDAVYDVLVSATRQLFLRPTLAQALLQAHNSAHAAKVHEAGRIDRTTRDLLLRALGVTEPTSEDRTAVWLLMQCWYGMLTTALNGRTSGADVEADLRVACRLLLAGRGSVRLDAELPAPEHPPAPGHVAG